MKDMAMFVEAGITTFDCADIYTGVEQLIGDFRRAYPALAREVQIHTKFVPDLSDLGSSIAAMSSASSTGRCSGWAWSGSTWCSSIGGTRRPRYVETALELGSAAARRQDRKPRRH